MVVAPRVVLAHARPEQGALAAGMSLVTTSDDVPFKDDLGTPLRLFFTLAAPDPAAHLELMAHLAEVLTDQDRLQTLATTRAPRRALEILQPR